MDEAYTARFSDHALAQLLFLTQFAEYRPALEKLIASTSAWRHYGPIGLDPIYEARELTDLGAYQCGRIHEFHSDHVWSGIVINARDLLVVEILCG